MKTRFLLIITTLAALAGINPVAAQTTAFTYQGRLNTGGSAAGGTYDFTFALYNNNSPSTGQVGSTLTNLGVSVSGGLFTVTLDFGANYPGANRWLAIAVRTNGTGGFTALSPLQPLTPTPYAIYAPNAATAATANGFSGSLAGDVTGTQSATAVTTVGGQTAASVASGASAANAATSAPTGNALVKRDGTGSFAAGTITANLAGNGSGLTNLNASQLSSGVVSANVLPGFQPAGGYITVGGGNANSATGVGSTIAGGEWNWASNTLATISGGSSNLAGGLVSTIGGGSLNGATTNYATVAGGIGNLVTGAGAIIAGGVTNTATGLEANITGGELNLASGVLSTISGGYSNLASGYAAAVAGGEWNGATGTNSCVGGGYGNLATNYAATVPGGFENVAGGQYSFAAGAGAVATHDGAFVWADESSTTAMRSTANNQFTARCAGGVRFFANPGATVGVVLPVGGNAWSPASDRNLKEHFTPVDPRAVLAKLVATPVTEWNLVSQDPAIRHIGPMAQDFKAAFGVGEDDRHISTTDADGVAFAAIQGLYQELKARDARIAGLESRLEDLEAKMEQLATPRTATSRKQ